VKGKFEKGRERPRLWLPRVGGRAGRSRPVAWELGAEPDHELISLVSRTDLNLIQIGGRVNVRGEKRR
jgi:hypothetical protein